MRDDELHDEVTRQLLANKRQTEETVRAALALRDAVDVLTRQGYSIVELCLLVNEIRKDVLDEASAREGEQTLNS